MGNSVLLIIIERHDGRIIVSWLIFDIFETNLRWFNNREQIQNIHDQTEF